MLDKTEVLNGRDFEIFMSGYAEGSKDAVSQMVGAATAYEEANPEEANSLAYHKGYKAATESMYKRVLSKLYDEEPKPLTLEEFAVQEDEDGWESIGKPMTQEELDELHCVCEDNCYADGYSDAEAELRKYNVVLDGDFLDQLKEFSDKILSYHKPFEDGKNKDHNFMLFDLNHCLIELTESWVMDQVWKYWDKE